MKTLRGWMVAVGLAVCAVAWPVAASAQQDESVIASASAVMDDAKAAYNAEQYDRAAGLYIRAAQLDLGGKQLSGSPYRNLARCMFWLDKYDQSVFWYQVYVRTYPDAKDREQVTSELDAANARRSSPERRVGPEAVYDKSVLQLIEALETRLKKHEPATTASGGGTSRLYVLAIERGYALPDLAVFARDLRGDLLSELEARFARLPRGPLPALGESSEALEVSRQRLELLRTLGPGTKEALKVAAYQLLLNGFAAFEGDQFAQAAEAFADASAALPSLDYLPWVLALARLRAGDAEAALKGLEASRAAAPEELGPWYDVLTAEALRARKDLRGAAAVYMTLLMPEQRRVKTLDPPTDDKVKTLDEAGKTEEAEAPRTIKTLGGSVGDKTIKKIEEPVSP